MRITAIFLIITFSVSLYSTIINIPDDYSTIQEGITLSVQGDTVLVAPGTYYENIFCYIKNITVASHFLTTQDTSYISQTIIDGYQNGCVIMLQGSYQDSLITFCGFTIQNGYNHFASGGSGKGGGIYILNDYILPTKPILDNLVIKNNYAESGGGLYIDFLYSDIQGPILRDVSIQNNSMETGGCVSINNAIVSMENVKILDNFGAQSFGGCVIYNSTIVINNSIIAGNSATDNTGGLVYITSNVYLSNVLIYDNMGFGIGNLYYIGESNVYLENVIISDNIGEGLRSFEDHIDIRNSIIKNNTNSGINLINSNTTIKNVLITGNGGQGIMINDFNVSYNDCNTEIFNSTITSNNEGGISCSSSGLHSNQTLLVNSILWDHGLNQIQLGSVCDMSIYNSNLQYGIEGISSPYWLFFYWDDSNIDSDPLFVCPEENDYHLQDNSTCIGAGTTSVELNDSLYFPEGTYFSPNFDIEGNPRPFPELSLPDMGAYENPFGEPQVSNCNNELVNSNSQLNNYPNPFNPNTTISFNLTTENTDDTKLSIYNIKGQKIRQFSIFNNQSSIIWDGKDYNNKQVSSGIYFYKLQTEGFQITKKMMLIK